MSNRKDSEDTDTNQLNRRYLLSTLGAAAATGLAGCSGTNNEDGSESPSGNDDGSAGTDGTTDEQNTGSDGDGTTGEENGTTSGGEEETGGDEETTGDEVGCSDLTAGYTTLDTGARPFVARVEYPSVLTDPVYNVEISSASVLITSGDTDDETTDKLTMGFSQQYDAKSEPRTGENDPVYSEVQFNGETVVVLESLRFSESSPRLVFDLPYEIDGEIRYFETELYLNVATGTFENISEECASTIETAIEEMLASLEPNPQSTIAEET